MTGIGYLVHEAIRRVSRVRPREMHGVFQDRTYFKDAVGLGFILALLTSKACVMNHIALLC